MPSRIAPLCSLRVVLGMQLDPTDSRVRVQRFYRDGGYMLPAEASGQVSWSRYEQSGMLFQLTRRQIVSL